MSRQLTALRASLRAATAPPRGHLLPFSHNATVVRVVDGDTIRVDVFYSEKLILHDWPIRLLGIAADPRGTPSGDGARAALTGLLPPGTPVALFLVTDYKYGGEWVADVHAEDADSTYSVNEWLVKKQWAAVWDGRGAHPHPPWPRTVT